MYEHIGKNIIMLILSLLVLQVLPVFFCYDVELKGSLNIANNLFGSGVLRQPSEFVSRLLSYLPSKIVGKGKLPRVDTIAIPYLTMNNNAKHVEKSQSQSIFEVFPFLLRSDNRNSENTNQKTDSLEDSSKLEQFMKHLKKTGQETIDSIAFYIKEEMNIQNNITHIVKIVTDDYTEKLQNYYDYVKENVSGYDRDLLYLDMIGTSHRLLFNEENKLLIDIFMHEEHNHHAHNGSYQEMYDELLRLSFLYKRDTMRYVYDRYKICKEYPAISDYGADLISEVLMLNDQQFLRFLQILAKIIKENDRIIARIAEEEDRDLIKAKLRDCTTDLFATKELFAIVRSAITQRFKPVTSGSEEFKVKIKATRILLDILDKALNVEEDWITFDLDISIRDIRNWRNHKRDDIDDILEDFAKLLMRRLEYNLTKNAREEIKVLITVIMRGESMADFQRLLKYGSKYLNCNVLNP